MFYGVYTVLQMSDLNETGYNYFNVVIHNRYARYQNS